MSSIDIRQLLSGDVRTLAKAITLIESNKSSDRSKKFALLKQIEPHAGNSIRIGITGVPGVGKSTFIDTIGTMFTSRGEKVAVVTIDPTSPLHGGSLLGDKSRMNNLAQGPNAFIRPCPSGGTLGGVASKTFETIKLCEAAGYNVIIVETVGVGQSEFEVKDIVDFFLLMILPNSGDDLQGIKKGIVELADLIVVNKCDGEAALQARESVNYYSSALQLIQKNSKWNPSVVMCSSIEKTGMLEIVQICDNYFKALKKSLDAIRLEQQAKWYRRLVREFILYEFEHSKTMSKEINSNEKLVLSKIATPVEAALKTVSKLFR